MLCTPPYDRMFDLPRRVYSTQGISPAVNTFGGGVFKKDYIWWNIHKDWMPLRNVRGLLRTQADTSSIPTRSIGFSSILQTIRLGGGEIKNTRSGNANIPHLQTVGADRP